MRENETHGESKDREKKKVKGHGDMDYVQDKPCWNVTVVTVFI